MVSNAQTGKTYSRVLLCHTCAPPESHYITSAVKQFSVLPKGRAAERVRVYLPMRGTVGNTRQTFKQASHIEMIIPRKTQMFLDPSAALETVASGRTFLCSARIP